MRITSGFIALVLLVACRKDTPDTTAAADPTAAPPAAIQAMVSMFTIDSAIKDVKPIEARLKGKLPTEHERLGKLWRLDGKPVKLVVPELTDAGEWQGETSWYFRNDSLVAATGPSASYAFADGRLVDWTDERGTTAARSLEALKSREQDLRTLASFWIQQFPRP